MTGISYDTNDPHSGNDLENSDTLPGFGDTSFGLGNALYFNTQASLANGMSRSQVTQMSFTFVVPLG